MAARTGMSAVITELRDMCLAGTADYTVNGVTYFSDDQLQTYLDRRQMITRMCPLQPVPVRVGSTVQWFDYVIPRDLGYWFEQYVDSTSGWAVKDGLGFTKVLGTDYTVNYAAQLITFTADQGGAAFNLDCKTYGLYAAAAEVWRKKAGLEWRSVDFKTDNHDIKASQRRDWCISQAEMYEAMEDVSGEGGIGMATIIRDDENLSRPNYAPLPGGFHTVSGVDLGINSPVSGSNS